MDNAEAARQARVRAMESQRLQQKGASSPLQSSGGGAFTAPTVKSRPDPTFDPAPQKPLITAKEMGGAMDTGGPVKTYTQDDVQ